MRGRGRSLESSEEGNVAAAADAVKVTAGEVAKILEPWVAVGIRHLGFDPEESVGGVVVLSREAALGGETVVDRDGNGGDLGDKVGAVAVSDEVGSGVEDPAAVVKVNEDGETGDEAVVGGDVGGAEEAEGGGGGGVEGEVLEGNGVGRGRGGEGGEVEEAGEGAVGVEGDAEMVVRVESGHGIRAAHGGGNGENGGGGFREIHCMRIWM